MFVFSYTLLAVTLLTPVDFSQPEKKHNFYCYETIWSLLKVWETRYEERKWAGTISWKYKQQYCAVGPIYHNPPADLQNWNQFANKAATYCNVTDATCLMVIVEHMCSVYMTHAFTDTYKDIKGPCPQVAWGVFIIRNTSKVLGRSEHRHRSSVYHNNDWACLLYNIFKVKILHSMTFSKIIKNFENGICKTVWNGTEM